MTTAEERMRILHMIQEGKISADEGAKLLEALGSSRKKASAAARQHHARSDTRMLHILITDLRSDKKKVNVSIPMSLVNVGVRLGARFMPSSAGVDFDEIMTTIDEGASGKIVDVEDGESGERVEVWVD